jgi:Tol biopolymer transport system component
MESCGESVLFPSGLDSLTHVDADGAEVTLRVEGGVTIATCTPDGKSIFYVTNKHPQKIMRLAVKGGPPVEAEVRGEITFGRIALSPDQRFFAYVSVEGSPGLTVAHVLRSDGGVTGKAFELPGSLRVRELSWSPTGKGLQYLIMRDGVMNIWEQPLDGKEPYQVTHFTSGLIFSFVWSSDHKHLLMTRGTISNDVALLEFRQ